MAIFFAVSSPVYGFALLTRIVRCAGISTLAASVFLMGLEFNRLVIARTRADQELVLATIAELAPPVDHPTYIVMKMDPTYDRRFHGLFADHFLQQHYHSRHINVIYIMKNSHIAPCLGAPLTRFDTDDKGLTFLDQNGKKRIASYDDVILAQFTAGKTTLLKTISAQDLVGYDAEFARTEPLKANEHFVTRLLAGRAP
jgi:hypothetical protein